MNLGSKLFPPSPPLPSQSGPHAWTLQRLQPIPIANRISVEAVILSNGSSEVVRLGTRTVAGSYIFPCLEDESPPIGRPAALARRHACARKKLIQLTTSSMHILRASSQESRHNAPLGRLPTRWCLASVITGLYESVLRSARPRRSQLSTPYSYKPRDSYYHYYAVL